MKPLKRIKSGLLSRSLSLAKVTMAAGAKAASHAMGELIERSGPDSRARLVSAQIELLARELGELKGSVMKVGQMLSMYGEHFLPPEANAFLKSLQSQSPPLEWTEMEKVLRRQLGPEKLALLDIDPRPLASASLGQVHRAVRRSDGRELALKIQYPGVDRAIDGDLQALRSLLSVANLLPRNRKYDGIFAEVRAMLHQEVDYRKELSFTRDFARFLEGDARYRVPEVFEEFSGNRVLATSFESGLAIDSPEVQGLSQERRDAIGAAALELYLREIFEFGMVQTDPHFGNYRLQPENEDRLVLLDFGAVRKFPGSFVEPYKRLVRGAMMRDREMLRRAALELGFLEEADSPDLQRKFIELCDLITEPFADPRLEYDWGASDLPSRVAKKGAEIVFGFRPRVPPREIVFLDRKMTGIFVFLSTLRVRACFHPILKTFTSERGLPR